MRALGGGKTSSKIEARISTILLEVEPLLRIEHCRIELVSFAPDSGALTLRIGGACPDCDVSPATFAPAIAAHVKQRVPEVREVILSA
jgi:Fe-S cluster biogenesis protein NfuA